MCKFQRVQIVNVLNVLSSWKEDTLELQRLYSEHSGGPADTQESDTKLFLEEDVGLLTLVCNFKKQKTNKNKQLLLDLGMILKWDNLLMSSSTDSVRNKHLEKWPLLREIQQPTSAASSKIIRAEEFFFLSTCFVHLWTWHFSILALHIRISFALKSNIITIQCFSPITKTTPFLKSWSLFSIRKSC